MTSGKKNQKEILNKLSIEELNSMQKEAISGIQSNSEVILLSPTGTGKTLAFLLPLINELDSNCKAIQALILVPSRELAIQIEQVTRDMGTGYKATALYGGRSGAKDRLDLKHPPAILIGTPGRIADSIRRERFSIKNIKTLVLDEFDKSLEVGFEAEMSEILVLIPPIQKKILTSATKNIRIPKFVGLENPTYIDYLHKKTSLLSVRTILSSTNDKHETLYQTLKFIGNQAGIVFCNFKDTIQEVSDFLTEKNISHGCFYGGMEQKDRERALIKFRNGTHQLLIATDLAARGIDVPELKFIIHFELPKKSKEYIHRNGRTARMNSEGVAYVLRHKNEQLPDFIYTEGNKEEFQDISESSNLELSDWKTLFISGGRKDKISKGDIAGMLFKQAKLNKDQVGVIELKQDCAFVGVNTPKPNELIEKTNNYRLKKKKVRVYFI